MHKAILLSAVALVAATDAQAQAAPVWETAVTPAPPAVHPMTSIDEVLDAVGACMAATGTKYVDLPTLAKKGWKIQEVFGDPAKMAINNYNKSGSNADIMIIKLAENPGSLQCSAIGRFPTEGSFAELDRRMESILGRKPDDRASTTTEDSKRTEITSWALPHKAITLAHFYGRASAMITMRYVE